LSCPFVDSSAACDLFCICLELFLEQRGELGRMIALDEAHKFMNGTTAANAFTEDLLGIIRQQRHLATRVIIATQEPTISPKLLDLCSMTFVHRFTSPEWMGTLRKHLAGASGIGLDDNDESEKHNVKEIFGEIVKLNAGQALLFSPSAMLDVNAEGKAQKLGLGYVKVGIRKRITTDGGRSIMAV